MYDMHTHISSRRLQQRAGRVAVCTGYKRWEGVCVCTKIAVNSRQRASVAHTKIERECEREKEHSKVHAPRACLCMNTCCYSRCSKCVDFGCSRDYHTTKTQVKVTHWLASNTPMQKNYEEVFEFTGPCGE